MVRVSCTRTLENPKWILSKLGLWINSDNTTWGKYKFVIGLTFNIALITLVCHNIINSIEMREIRVLNRMTCMLVEGLTYLAKLSTIILNKKCFASILTDLESEAFNSHNHKLNENIQYIHKISKLLFGYFIITILTYLVFGTFLPVVVNISPMVPAPFNTGKYDVVYRFILIILCNCMAFSSVGLDTLYLTLLSLSVAQLNILEGKLLEVVDNIAIKVESKKEMAVKGHAVLREIVRLHEAIIQFTKKLSTFLSFPFFAQYACGCFMVCNTVLQFTILREPGITNTLNMCCYAAVTFGQMSAYHLLGNEIMYKSNTLVESSYSSKWYQLDLKSKKTLLLLMERAKIPLIIKSYKYIFINLDSLGVIVRWAYSIFALIKASYG